MEVMIQPYSSGVDHAGTQRRKLGMLLVEATDGRGIVRLSVARAKLSVTLGTRRIRGCLQEHRTLVLNVAGRTRGSECLIGIVQRSVVASKAGLVSHSRGERASPRNVTERALLRENGVRIG
jgi:hypothetical protein